MSTLTEVKLSAADVLASKGRYDETVEKYLRGQIEPNIGTNSEIQKILADIENPCNYNECSPQPWDWYSQRMYLGRI